MSRSQLLEEWLKSPGPILADGAMGTLLHARGVPMDACFDELNLTQPDLIIEAHAQYLAAGAQIIETNTFGANSFKLAVQGLDHQTRQINSAAVALARKAIQELDREALIAGSVGPLGVRLAPYGRVQPQQAFAAYEEQIAALSEAGADLIMIETQNDLYELREAVRAARAVCDLPVIASMTFTRDDRTLLGDSPGQVAKLLVGTGADLIGANCSGGPSQLLRVLQKMRAAAPEARFCLMPNAGWPEQIAGRIMYSANEEYFAEYAHAFADAGASIIGGCCGSTPEHIAAMREALDSRDPKQPVRLSMGIRRQIEEVSPQVQEQTELARRLDAGKFVISVEIDPPRGFGVHKMIAGAHLLAEAGADTINVADSPMARMRMSPWAVCQLIQREVGVESVLHFPTRGRNILRVQGDLLAAHATGVRNIFVVMGDPTSIGDYPEAMDDYDVVPSGLVKLIKYGFNLGVDHAGADIGEAASFFVGCALNPTAGDQAREARILKRKIDAGADFILTQPVYQPQAVRSFLKEYQDRYGELTVPMLVGILPLISERHASFLHNEVPGILVPDSTQKRISAAGNQGEAEGIAIAVDLLKELSGFVQGAYLMPPMNRFGMAAEIIEAMEEERQPSRIG